MKRFTINQEVLALTNPKGSGSQMRVKGNIYTVKEGMFCCSCGTQLINIGGVANEKGHVHCSCGIQLPNHALAWTLSKHFAPINKKTLNMLVGQEEYTLAVVVRDKLIAGGEIIKQSID